jgi:PAS domain S-box-containing protein
LEEMKHTNQKATAQKDMKKTVKKVAKPEEVIEAIGDGISIQDTSYVIVYQNEKHRSLFGDHTGEHCYKAYQLRDSECEACPIAHTFNDGKTHTIQMELQSGSGIRCLEVTASSLTDSKGKTIAGIEVVRDITERKQAEEHLRKLSDELSRSNTDLQQFAYVASHDLQEPLRVIAGFVKLLAKRYKGQLDDEAEQFINYTVDGVKTMEMLIKDLLEYSRVQSNGMALKPSDCDKLVKECVKSLQTVIEESGAKVTYDSLPNVKADASQLVRVFQNLISNAVKFHGDEKPKVHISAEKKENEWVFSIRDNGIGINPKQAERIFLIFQRLHTKEEYPGTGVGLAICKRIIEHHGGRIWVESEVGRGSTFFFTIPDRN